MLTFQDIWELIARDLGLIARDRDEFKLIPIEHEMIVFET